MNRTIRLQPVPRSVGIARHFVTEQTRDLPAEVRQVAELCASELVTNSVLHADTEVAVSVIRDSELRVEVTDERDGHVEPRHPAAHEPHGRGLQIVQALADHWGVRPAHPGKTVWFDLRLDGNRRAAEPAVR